MKYTVPFFEIQWLVYSFWPGLQPKLNPKTQSSSNSTTILRSPIYEYLVLHTSANADLAHVVVYLGPTCSHYPGRDVTHALRWGHAKDWMRVMGINSTKQKSPVPDPTDQTLQHPRRGPLDPIWRSSLMLRLSSSEAGPADACHAPADSLFFSISLALALFCWTPVKGWSYCFRWISYETGAF